MKKLLLIFALLLAHQVGLAANGDLTAVRIGTNGFDAFIDITGFTDSLGTIVLGLTGNNDPTAAKIVFTVTSPGYDTTGAATTLTRTVYGTKLIRYAYPAAWAGTTAYALNATVVGNGYVQKCITAGTSLAGAPTWNTTVDGTTSEGGGSTVVWKNMGAVPAASAPAVGPAIERNAVVAGKLTLRVALSEFIYSADTPVTVTVGSGFYTDNGTGGTGLASNTVSGLAVTNNSTLAYPKPVGRWAWPGYEIFTAAFPLEFVAFHRFARLGSEVAAVKFTCTDSAVHSNSVTVSAMTKSTRVGAGDVNPVLVYAATMPTSTFVQGIVTCQAIAYPWVGNLAAQLNTAVGQDGVTQPSESLGPLTEIFDAGTYGASYALVAAAGGSDVTCTGLVFSTQVAAEAANLPFATNHKAASCLQAYNNTNYTRNEPGNSFILLSNGSYNNSGTGTVLNQNNVWLTIKPMSTATQAGVTFNLAGGNTPIDSDGKLMLKVQGLTIAGSGNNIFVGNPGTTESLWLHNLVINNNATAAFYKYGGAMYVTNNNITLLSQALTSFSINKSPLALIRGNTCPNNTLAFMYALIGNTGCVPLFVETGDVSTGALSDNSVVAFNTNYGMSSPNYSYAVTSVISKGIAFVQNVFEATGVTGPLIGFSADFSTSNVSNVLLQHNTLVGQNGGTFTPGRINLAYNDINNVTRYNWLVAHNNFAQLNVKTDTFSTQNGARVGNWAVVYGIGFKGNVRQGVLSFDQDFIGLGTAFTGSPAYVFDNTPSGVGSGNYMIQSTSDSISPTPFLTSTDQALPFDLRGAPRSGAPQAGAYVFQQAGSVISGTSTVNGPSTTR